MTHHTRVHQSVLAAAEKRLLVRIAGRLRMFDVGGLVATAGMGAALAMAVIEMRRRSRASSRGDPGSVAGWRGSWVARWLSHWGNLATE